MRKLAITFLMKMYLLLMYKRLKPVIWKGTKIGSQAKLSDSVADLDGSTGKKYIDFPYICYR